MLATTLRSLLSLGGLLSLGSLPTTAFAASQIQGAPWKYHIIDSGLGADGARFQDVNKDGLLDIATSWEQGDLTRVYINPGFRSAVNPWPYVTVGSTPSAEDALLADINGDGAYDVISSTEGDTQALYVEFAPENPADYLNSAAWSQVNLNGAVNAPVNNQYMFSVVNDLNGDGRPDIIAGGKEGSQLGYFTSTSGSVLNPANWTYHKLRDVGWTMSLLQYDFDHDGDLDVLLSDRRIWKDPANGANTKDQRGVYWLENPGPVALAANPDMPWTEHTIGVTGKEAMLLDLGDINGDGLPDIAVPTGKPTREVHLFFALDNTGLHYKEVVLNIEDKLGDGFGDGGKALSIVDVDRDGKKDLVFTAAVADGDKSGVVWLSYGTDPTNPDDWTVHQIAGADGEKYDLAAIADLNGDGYPDVITTEEHNNSEDGDGGLGLIWYENPGAPKAAHVPKAPTVVLKGKRTVTAKTKWTIHGSAQDDGRVASVEVKVGKSGFKRAKGTTQWKFTAKLSEGRNAIVVRAIDNEGLVSSTRKLTIVRKSP